MEICEVCKKEFMPLNTTAKKNKHLYCSQSCRVRLWVLKQRKIQIEKGNYGGMTMNSLEKLGYEVTIKKKATES